MKLNLGCADRKIPDYIGVDIAGDAEFKCDLSLPWPWIDSSIEAIKAHDVIEHIGDCDHLARLVSTIQGFHRTSVCDLCAEREEYGESRIWRHRLGRIHFMNELHRVLVPGGEALIETPNAANGVGFFQDPTHVSPWCLSTFKYFEDNTHAWKRLSAAYGITARFQVLELYQVASNGEDPRETVWKIIAKLKAVK